MTTETDLLRIDDQLDDEERLIRDTVRAFVADRFAEIEAFFHRSIKAAQAEGQIPRDRAAKDLARLLLGVLLGIRVLARSKPERTLLEGVARPALALLD